ncbi:hypothetical protein PAHAL_1G234300 [Panicum hallii]|uniref:Cathepsin propeptide inhibitor domain-containing protein n=1 Tax=Panicum hallii TaxID=206008 RepID=A0A2S3GNJ2_9POAL|nr:hypothetical protein PAHAL_1G234300 [Panicum hallii]
MNTDVSELDFVAQEAKLQCKVNLQIHEDDLASDEALWSLYERWCKVFNQERDSDEMARRFQTFKDNVLLVYRVNNFGLPYKLKLNKFSDGKLKELCYPRLADNEYFVWLPYSNSRVAMRGNKKPQEDESAWAKKV